MATLTTNIKGPIGPKGDVGNQGIIGPTAVSTDANNQARLGTDSKILSPVITVPLATSSANGWLCQVSNKTTDFINGSNQTQDITPVITAAVGNVRLINSINLVHNPNFEIDQRNFGASSTGNAGGGVWAADRWLFAAAGTSASTRQVLNADAPGYITVPGTGYPITSKYLRLTLNTQQTVLGATDIMYYQQAMEGQQIRPIFYNYYAVSLLVRSSVANLSFTVSMRSNDVKSCLLLLCTLGAANTWTLITLPNNYGIQYGSTTGGGAGIWSTEQGSIGAYLGITLACGSTYTLTNPSATYSNGNYMADSRQSNFAASPVGSTFDLAYVQIEPSLGPGSGYCSPPIEVPYDRNLRTCQRYYATSWFGSVAPSGNWCMIGNWSGSTTIRLQSYFPVPMAKIPTAWVYTAASGFAINTIYIDNINASAALTGAVTASATGIYAASLTATPTGAAPHNCIGFWKADTGW